MTTSTKLPIPSTCRKCGRKLDGATDPFGEATPKDGDVSFCIYCGTLSVFQDGYLRAPTDEEQVDIDRDPRLVAIQRAWEGGQRR